MAVLRMLLSLILLGVGLNFVLFVALTPFYMLWVGDAPSYSEEYTRNHVLTSLGYGAGAAIIGAAALYGSYSLFWNKINIWSKISFGIVFLTIALYFGFYGLMPIFYPAGF